MSSTAGGGLLTTSVFNPALLRKEDLVRGFVARQDLLERLLDDLRRVRPGTAPQHQLLIGQRGLGKTTLLRRLAFAIEDDQQLSAAWMPLVFPEEQYNVKGLGDFWLNCADALSDALDRVGEKGAAEALDQRVECVPADPERRSEEGLKVMIEEADRLGRGLVLLVDNLDIVLDRLNEAEEWEFRRVISAEHRLYILGASSRALEALYEHGRAFYDYFQVHDLKGLTDDETFALLSRLAKEAGDERVQRLVREKPGRVRALRVLTGGNPRTLVLLYRVLAEGPEGDAQRDVEQLLDLYTPLYKTRFEELAPQLQQLVDAMAIHWDPLTAGNLAEILAPLSVNQVSAQLKRLEDLGVVEKAPWFGEKKAAFQIAERFFNIWYLMRASRRVRRRLVWLVKFLEAWFEREELSELARGYLQQNPETMGRERYAELALAYSQTVDDRHLRRSLESAGLQAALDVSVEGLIDFSDLPPELQDRRERMVRLRELRARVLGTRFEGVEPAALWHLMGGSPQLLLEEKARVVEGLPPRGTAELRALYGKLQRAENRLREAYGRESVALARLYEVLATGEMADVYDLEGALSVAKRWGCPRLPLMAISSRVSTRISSGSMSQAEMDRAEEVLRELASEPGYEAQGWHGLGDLLQTRLGRFEEAEVAYRRANKFDPQDAYVWNKLGNLLNNPLRRFEEAEQAYHHAIEIDSQSAYPWNNLGLLLQHNMRRFEEAEVAYRRAIEIDPHFASPLNNLGNLLKGRLRGFEESEQAYRRAIDVDPQYAYPWHNLGLLLETDSNRQPEALDAFLRALEIDPTHVPTKQELLRVARSMDTGSHLPAALRAVDRLRELLPDAVDVQFVLGGLLALSGQWDEPRALIERLALSEIGTPNNWTFRALVQSGHLADAIALLERTGADQRWRPLYEALRAIQAGSADYLRRVAPEVRTIAQEIFDEIGSGLRQSVFEK